MRRCLYQVRPGAATSPSQIATLDSRFLAERKSDQFYEFQDKLHRFRNMNHFTLDGFYIEKPSTANRVCTYSTMTEVYPALFKITLPGICLISPQFQWRVSVSQCNTAIQASYAYPLLLRTGWDLIVHRSTSPTGYISNGDWFSYRHLDLVTYLDLLTWYSKLYPCLGDIYVVVLSRR